MNLGKSSSLGVLVACGLVAAGCAVDGEEGTAKSADQVAKDAVIAADLDLVRSTFGLSNDGVKGIYLRDDARLQAGKCYKAYGTEADVAVHRWTTGAAFYSKTSGSVLCVDLDKDGRAWRSFDGVGLDAIFRYGLGKPLSSDGPNDLPTNDPGKLVLTFEHGKMVINIAGSFGPKQSEIEEMRGDTSAKQVVSPLFIEGRLLGVNVDNAQVYNSFSQLSGGPELEERALWIDGQTAAFTYVAALAKNSGGHSLNPKDDPLGGHATREGETAGVLHGHQGSEGPSEGALLYFRNAHVSGSSILIELPEEPYILYQYQLADLSLAGQPQGKVLVECTYREILEGPYSRNVVERTPITCTGEGASVLNPKGG